MYSIRYTRSCFLRTAALAGKMAPHVAACGVQPAKLRTMQYLCRQVVLILQAMA